MPWIRRFFVDLTGSYLDSLRAMRAPPWLFGAIIVWEFAQHVVEVRNARWVARREETTGTAQPTQLAV